LSNPKKVRITLSPPDATVESAASHWSAAACVSTWTEYAMSMPRIFEGSERVTSVTVSDFVCPHLLARVFLSPCRMASVKSSGFLMTEKRRVPLMVNVVVIVLVGVEVGVLP